MYRSKKSGFYSKKVKKSYSFDSFSKAVSRRGHVLRYVIPNQEECPVLRYCGNPAPVRMRNATCTIGILAIGSTIRALFGVKGQTVSRSSVSNFRFCFRFQFRFCSTNKFSSFLRRRNETKTVGRPECHRLVSLSVSSYESFRSHFVAYH